MRRKIVREELYRWIWERPTTKVAAELGVSDSAIGKICRRMNIPKPPPGYWAQVEHGKETKRAPLPTASEHTVLSVEIHPTESFLKDPPGTSNSPSPIILYCPGAPPKIINKVLGYINGKDLSDTILIQLPRNEGFPEIVVSMPQIQRTLSLLGTLIVNLEAIGCSVGVSKNYWGEKTRITKEGQEITISISERLRKIEPLPGNGSKQKPPYLLTDPDKYLPSGRLQIKVNGTYSEFMAWRDRKHQPLESRLEEILRAILAIVDAKILRHRIQEAEKRKREEEIRLQREEEARREQLRHDLSTWEYCERVRVYLQAFEARLEQLNASEITTDDQVRWLKWAKEYINQIDPMSKIGL